MLGSRPWVGPTKKGMGVFGHFAVLVGRQEGLGIVEAAGTKPLKKSRATRKEKGLDEAR